MIIVTSGSKYIDIDAYACILGYAELLKLLGKGAKAISNGVLNESITPSLKTIDSKLDSDYKVSESDEFIIVDTSNPDFFDECVEENQVIKVIDHHYGFEEYWERKIGKENTTIEFIGAAATLVFEEYIKANMQDKINPSTVKLLMAAILDNTLNFTAKITSYRDRDAYEQMSNRIKIDNFDEIYFAECQNEIEKDLGEAIKNDTKIGRINDILPSIFGQLTVWNKDYILSNMEIVNNIFDSMGEKWVFNLICISDKKSYIISKDKETQGKLSELLESSFNENIMPLKNAMLRKEIIKKSKEI